MKDMERVAVNPELLRWACERAGLGIDALGVSMANENFTLREETSRSDRTSSRWCCAKPGSSRRVPQRRSGASRASSIYPFIVLNGITPTGVASRDGG